MARSRPRSLSRVPAVLLLAVALAAGASCSGEQTAAKAVEPAGPTEVDGVHLAGPGGRSHHRDDGRVVLTLAASDEVAVSSPAGVETHPLTAAPAHVQDVHPDVAAELAVEAAGTAFVLSDVTVDDVDAATIVVTGVSVGAVPPERFEDWTLTAGTTDGDDEVLLSSPASATPVVELTDDEVAAALAAAPPPPLLTGLTLAPAGPPSGFAADVELRLDAAGRYEVDVNTPGAPDERPLRIVLSVDGSVGKVDVAAEDPTGHLTLSEARPVPGGGTIATLRAAGFDVAEVDRVSVQARRQDDDAAPRPWETSLGCTPTSNTFEWRTPDDATVKVGACPHPYDWMVAGPVTPSLMPDPVEVAAAAGFAAEASLAERLDALIAVSGGVVTSDGGRVLELGVQALIEVNSSDGVPPVRIPVLRAQLDAADFDATATADAIETWRTSMGVGAVTFVVDVGVRSSDSSAALLTVRDVRFPRS